MSEALLARRKLGNELLRLREDAGWTQAADRQASLDLGHHGPSHGARAQPDQRSTDRRAAPRPGDRRPEAGSRLVDSSPSSAKSGGQPYDQYRESLSNEALQFFGYEEVATAIRDLQIVFVPGLLQIRRLRARSHPIGTGHQRRHRRISVLAPGPPAEGDLPRHPAEPLVHDRRSGAVPPLRICRDHGRTAAETPGARGTPRHLDQSRAAGQGGQPGPARVVHPPGVRQVPRRPLHRGPARGLNVYEEEATRARRATWTALESQLAVRTGSRPLHTKGA